MLARSARLLSALLLLGAAATPLAAQEAEPGSGQRPSRQRAASKPKAAPAGLPGGGQASLVASFGDWGVYAARTEGSQICYAASQPKDRQPKNLNRDPAYIFVSFRPKDNVKGEVALVLGFTAKEGASADAVIGQTTYALVTKGANAWLRNAADDGQAITTMSRGQTLLIKTVSGRGNQLTDRYSLSGFGQALERARKECGAAGA